MRALLQIDFRSSSPETVQKRLLEVCEGMKEEDLIGAYHFEIEAPGGPVTEKCVLDGGKVIA